MNEIENGFMDFILDAFSNCISLYDVGLFLGFIFLMSMCIGAGLLFWFVVGIIFGRKDDGTNWG